MYEKLSGKGEWLFDTGASCHMTGMYEYLENVKNIFPYHGRPTRWQPSNSKQHRNRQSGAEPNIKNVLFVHKLTCNLIYTYQLNKDSNCAVTFTDSFYVKLDRISRTLIIVGKVKG